MITVRYTGDCEELYGREIEVEEHDCRDHIRHHYQDNVETHGLECGPYERWTDEWWECSICGAREDEIDDDPESGAALAMAERGETQRF